MAGDLLSSRSGRPVWARLSEGQNHHLPLSFLSLVNPTILSTNCCIAKKPAVVQRDIPATPLSWCGYLQLRVGRGCHGGAQDLPLDPSYSILKVQCIYDWSVVAFTSPHFSPCHVCFSVPNTFMLWLVHLKFSVAISQKLDEQITTTRYHPTAKVHCNFGTGFGRILPTDLS